MLLQWRRGGVCWCVPDGGCRVQQDMLDSVSCCVSLCVLQIAALEASKAELAAQLVRVQDAMRLRELEVCALREENDRLKALAADEDRVSGVRASGDTMCGGQVGGV